MKIRLDYGRNMAQQRVYNMARKLRARSPLTIDSLRGLALRYVERYATTQLKLRRYLQRKVEELGWDGSGEPPIDTIVARMAELKYVDDRVFGEMRARGLERRGYGPRRVRDALAVAGLDCELRDELSDDVDAHEAAIAYARRRRFGPFAAGTVSPELRQKHFAAMMRAGHAPNIVKLILDAPSEDALTDLER